MLRQPDQKSPLADAIKGKPFRFQEPLVETDGSEPWLHHVTG